MPLRRLSRQALRRGRPDPFGPVVSATSHNGDNDVDETVKAFIEWLEQLPSGEVVVEDLQYYWEQFRAGQKRP